MSTSRVKQNGDVVDRETIGRLPPSNNLARVQADVARIPSDNEADVIEARIGREYQAEIPARTRETNYMHYYPEDDERVPSPFEHGLDVPLTWVKCTKHEGPAPAEGRRRCCYKGYTVVPGLPGVNWTDSEKGCFLLGLYMFDKNFAHVRKFLETKCMRAILTYYYGEFYRSREYSNWRKGRKNNKKVIHGPRIFSGLRLLELQSRLFRKVSEECKTGVLQLCKAFAEDGMPFEDYALTLKTLVGTDTLVEAVGIGTQRSITRMLVEPPRSHHTTHARPEIPSGKACSSLTTAEIIKFLSGDYRLSKARANDLFWEAVWPRLLARGWQSEQPENQGYISGSKSLVFLVPGVKKFSRRRLVKGEDYFDSITDVLSKVGQQPELIELQEEIAEGSRRGEENAAEVENEQPAQQRQVYLQPRAPTRISDAVQFTVVDTSLPGSSVRAVRTLPSRVPSVAVSHSPHSDSDSDSEDTTQIDTIIVDVSESQMLTIAKAEASTSAVNYRKKPRKASKTISRKQKQGNASDHVVPMSKRCKRFTANTNEEPKDAPALEYGASHCSPDVRSSNGNPPAWHDKPSSASSSRESPSECGEPSQSHLLIDLNWPTPGFDINALPIHEPPVTSQEQNQSEPTPSVTEPKTEEQAVANPRRWSTRYRPPTTRTLEAVASGFLSVARRRKNKDASSSRPAQRVRIQSPGEEAENNDTHP